MTPGRTASALAPLLFWAAGCTTPPPPQLVAAGTIRNQAAMTYSFGSGRRFLVKSEPADLTVLMPIPLGAGREAAGDQESSSAAARLTRAEAGGTVEIRPSRANIRPAALASTRQSNEAAEQVTHSAERERHLLSNAAASQESTERTGGMGSRSISSRRAEAAAASSIRAVPYAGVQTGTLHHACQFWQTASAAYPDASSQSEVSWSARQPSIRKSASTDRVLAGARFSYAVEIVNDTGLDLAQIELADRLDGRLRFSPSDIRLIPAVTSIVTCSNQLLRIRFPGGLQRGKVIHVILPVSVSESAFSVPARRLPPP